MSTTDLLCTEGHTFRVLVAALITAMHLNKKKTHFHVLISSHYTITCIFYPYLFSGHNLFQKLLDHTVSNCIAGNKILPLGIQNHFVRNLNSLLCCWLVLLPVCWQNVVQNLILTTEASSENFLLYSMYSAWMASMPFSELFIQSLTRKLTASNKFFTRDIATTH